MEKKIVDALLQARDHTCSDPLQIVGQADSHLLSVRWEKIQVLKYIWKVPLKYEGLAPWEIWLSEAQERWSSLFHLII